MKISAQSTLLFYGHKRNYVSACVIKPYDILKVKNTLVMFVYNITEYTIYGLEYTILFGLCITPLFGREGAGIVIPFM